MTDVKRFSGVMDTDSKEADVLPPHHIRATNVRFTGGQNGLTAQNIKGNILISNSNLPSGTNECIGAYFDTVGQTIYWFNYNSFGNHGIYTYGINSGTVSQLFRCGVNSSGDVLGFSLDYPITSVALVYRTAGEGNLLYWTDGTNKPMYLNVETISALSPFTANMLYVAKMPPYIPPTVAYGSDATRNYNNVYNRYFHFMYRWVYKNNEKSTFSPVSIMPLPSGITNPEANIQSNTNNYISVTVNSGITQDFDKIEIVCQEFNGTTWGDYFLVLSVDRDEIGTPIPFVYSFNFYNDGIYNPVLVKESDQLFDYVPDKANCLELLNGNTIIYGGITEGYDILQRQDTDVQITSALATGSAPADVPAWLWGQTQRFGIIYFDQQGKTNSVISYLADASIDTNNFDVTAPSYPGSTLANFYQVPKISASINHLPPSWAATYRWVRMDLTPPFFLQYLTNDYQTDNDYLYLCIQSLIENNTRTGFVPSYEFKTGDRVKILGRFNSTVDITAFSTQNDYQILEVVQRTMNGSTYNPATSGAFLKVKKPSSFPTPAYTAVMLIQIYTPPAIVTDATAIFYEWGQEYAITGGYHMGQTQNQTGSQPALFEWFNGDVYQKQRNFPAVVVNTNIGAAIVMDRNYNDFQNSKANSNSRGWAIDVNAHLQYFPVTSRWGGSYIQDTNVNNINRFYPADQDTIDLSKGDIMRFKARDRILRVFQKRGVGRYGVFAKYIQNNDDDSQLVTTNSIITADNINYYDGVVGLGGYGTNLCSSPIADYFTDVVTGRAQRLGYDGLTDLGVLYKGQYYFPQLVTPYNKTLLRTNGARAKVMAFFDTFDGDYHCILQANTTTGAAQHFSFNEPRNGFVCDEYSYIPEWAICANDIIFSWKEGNLYSHNSSTYCNFYNVQYDASLTVVFNKDLTFKKSWASVSEIASDTWDCPTIYTNVNTYGTQRQESNLVAAELTKLEGMPSSAFKRDSNSPGGKVNGQFLKGNYIVIKFRKQGANNLITLAEATVLSKESPLTPR